MVLLCQISIISYYHQIIWLSLLSVLLVAGSPTWDVTNISLRRNIEEIVGVSGLDIIDIFTNDSVG